MELNKKELKKLIKTENTISKVRKQVQQMIKYWGYDETEIYVRCYSEEEWNEQYSTYLQVEMTNGDEWETISVQSITLKHNNNVDENIFEELTRDIFKTMKNNIIKDFKTYNIKVVGTEDYHI